MSVVGSSRCLPERSEATNLIRGAVQPLGPSGSPDVPENSTSSEMKPAAVSFGGVSPMLCAQDVSRRALTLNPAIEPIHHFLLSQEGKLVRPTKNNVSNRSGLPIA